MNKPICKECEKEIYAINKVDLVKGVELPTFIHSVCYERLKEFEYMYKDLCK